MKLAITGKGGVGKTTITAILARTLARTGASVIAVDADPNPNLGIALGLGVEQTARLDSIANLLLRERAASQHSHDHAGPGHVHQPDHDEEQRPSGDHQDAGVEELLAEIGIVAPDGVLLVQTGRIERPSEGCMCCGSHRTTRRVFEEIDGRDRIVLADLEAGVTDLLWAEPKPGDAVYIVVTPDRSALEVASRALQVTRDLKVEEVVVVANRVQHPADGERVRQFFPGVTVVEIPEHPAIRESERQALSPLDLAPQSAAIKAVEALGSRLVAR